MKDVSFKMFKSFYQKMLKKYKRSENSAFSIKALRITADTFVKAGYDPVQVSSRLVWHLEYHMPVKSSTVHYVIDTWWNEYRFIDTNCAIPFSGWRVI